MFWLVEEYDMHVVRHPGEKMTWQFGPALPFHEKFGSPLLYRSHTGLDIYEMKGIDEYLQAGFEVGHLLTG